MEREYQIDSVQELEQVVDDVLQAYMERENKSSAFVLALHGDLGAGKTTLMQLLATKLGVTGVVTSPTFVIMKKYETTDETVQELIHIDAYRIEEVDEMRPLRFTEELEKKDTMIGIEWAEHISALLPEDTLHLTFALEGETRIITTHGQKN